MDPEREFELEAIKVALEVEYPSEMGWQLWSDCLLDEVEVAFLLQKPGQKPVATIVVDSPYLTRNDLQMVDELKAFYKHNMDGQELHVLLVYRSLLFHPQRIPKGISLMVLNAQSGQRPATALN